MQNCVQKRAGGQDTLLPVLNLAVEKQETEPLQFATDIYVARTFIILQAASKSAPRELPHLQDHSPS